MVDFLRDLRADGVTCAGIETQSYGTSTTAELSITFSTFDNKADYNLSFSLHYQNNEVLLTLDKYAGNLERLETIINTLHEHLGVSYGVGEYSQPSIRAHTGVSI